ncbi:RNA polymerase sigma factor [Phenylobacterium deserti]|uniref:Sigma-70 family RNA polymerase sigma factor n=1 Tax=Phenylobacterium deserti TaxID=1914756 RepID=A0A328ADU2_9CAUL|nr:sigma-70 family RNA polymerase sigma factor [Phenylobacterium deserti]RAK52667.1 sigma-70 family RNA polymerase sigma factor [Phenylobacterium deserti]
MSQAALQASLSAPGLRDGASSFADLARRLRGPLIRYFVRRLGPSCEPEEMVQELFLRLLRRPDLTALDNVDGYVFEAAANLCRDKARRNRSWPEPARLDLQGLDATDDAPGAEQVVGGRQNLARVRSALRALPARTRTVVILRRFEDMSHAEIAARLRISVSAVEKHLARAMIVLRDALQETGG